MLHAALLARIRVYDSPLRFLVPSEANEDDHYVVDLSDPEFKYGRCECDDYNIRIESYLKKNQEPPIGRKTCKHIDWVVEKYKRPAPTKQRRGRKEKPLMNSIG